MTTTPLQDAQLQLQILQNQAAGVPLQAEMQANQFAKRLAQIETQIATVQAQISTLENPPS